MRLRLFQLLSGLTLLLSGAPARADLAFGLTPAVQSGAGSNEFFFTGTLINTNPTDNLYLNDIRLDFIGGSGSYLAADTNAFFANVPGILLPFESYSDVVFGITIDPATPPGQYFGFVTLRGGTNIFAAADLASPIFEVSLLPAALDIAPAGTNVILSWLSPPGGFELQKNSDLTTTNWLTVTNLPAFTNGLNQVMLSGTNDRLFFRLKYP